MVYLFLNGDLIASLIVGSTDLEQYIINIQHYNHLLELCSKRGELCALKFS